MKNLPHNLENLPPRKPIARLHKRSTLLLIVDVQERLMPAIDRADLVEKNCILLARAAALLQIPVLVTEQNPTHLGGTLETLRQVLPPQNAISKMRFSALNENVLEEIQTLQRQTILLCGVESHVCVLQSALDLLDAEYSVFAARDAISSRAPENAQVGWDRMMRAGVLPTSTESAIFEWLETADSPAFKALLPFVK